MKRLRALMCAVTSIAALAATVRLAAQGPQPNAPTTKKTQSFVVLHNFKGSDGANPTAGLVMGTLCRPAQLCRGPDGEWPDRAARNLYGTTGSGGTYGYGTVFKLGPFRHDMTVLYNFTGGSNGKWPYASVTPDREGNLYGTTSSGGDYENGTVFKLDTFGNETVLHSFAGGSDGSHPLAGLMMDAAGNLYGTTYVGGADNNGTVFKLDSSGNETLLYTFTGGSDGGGPYAGCLITDAAGNFYGTTSYGGVYGFGTVFKLDTLGHETVLHSFHSSDGWAPYSGVIMDRAGNLYGTTGLGGTSTNCSTGCGTVFRLDSSGQESVLHTFTGLGGDGMIPLAGLIRDRLGNLYGTTAGGGSHGGGIVFKLDTSGHETVLHGFTGSDLAYSNGNLIMDRAGNLYGTTFWGGASGNGTVYKIRAGAHGR